MLIAVKQSVPARVSERWIQMLRIMKLTSAIMLILAIQVSASGYSQKVNLRLQNVSLEEVIKAIQRQTGIQVFYKNEVLEKTGKVSVTIRDMLPDKALEKALASTDLVYKIVSNTYVISQRLAETENNLLLNKTPEKLPEPVKGKILNKETGKPMAGATIYNKTTQKYKMAGNDGGFGIEARQGDELVITYIGMKTVFIRVSGTDDLMVWMDVEENKTELVITTGYSSKKVAELTGALQTIQGDELRNGVSTTNTLGMLKGKTTGLYITETGGGTVANKGQVVMRGQASFGDAGNPNYGPLIVLDGVITTAVNLQDIVNPNDIEDIVVLKDAASTSIYGSRAAQGVLLITTKRGVKGQVRVNLNMKYGQTKDNRLVRFMNTQETAAHINKYMEAMYNGTASIRTQFPTLQDFINTTRPFKDADLSQFSNWDKVLFTDGHEKDINLALSGGSDKTRFYGAVDWYKEDGTLIDDNLDRKSIRLNIDQQVSEKFTVGFNANAIIDKYVSSSSENQYYLFQPWVSTTYANGQLADSIPNYVFRPTAAPATQWYDNPVYSHTYNTNIRKVQSYLGTVVLKYKILPWLSLQSTNTLQFLNNNYNSYRDPRTYRGRWDGPASGRVYVNGEISIQDSRTEYYLTSNQVNFNKSFGKHQVTALVGQEYGRIHTESIGASAYNTAYPGERNIAAFKNFGSWLNVLTGIPEIPAGLLTAIPAPADKASFSLFSEASYNYMQRYFASASLRRDASTNFGQLNRYAVFYSLSGGWLVSKENFMKNIRPVTNLKLRASYGASGREAGADYLNFTTYTDNVRYNDQNTFGATIQRLGNSQITWETTKTINTGIDLGLWKRIDLTIDWYKRRSKNLIQTVPLPSYIGFASQTRNVGEIENTGIEITLSSLNIKQKDFEWATDFNISFNKNRLTKIYGDSLIDPWSRSYYRYAGEDLNVLKAVIYAGVNPDNGSPLFERVMPDGKVQLVDSLPLVLADGTRSFKTVGSATPKFFGGFTNTFRYKGISLALLFNFVYGNTIMNQSVNNFYDPTSWKSGFALVNPDKAIRSWQGPGDNNANYPNFYDLAFAQRGATNFRASLIYQDASYISLRNIRLGYELSKKALAKTGIKSANIYLSMDNVFVVKSDQLFAADPEGARLGSTSGSFTGTGFSSAMPRRFIAGINLSF